MDTTNPPAALAPAIAPRRWSKHEVLRTLDELRDFWRDYTDLLGAGLDAVPLSEEKRALIEFHRGQAGSGRPVPEKMRDLVALLGDIVEQVKQEALAFLVPTRSALLPEEHNPELSRLSRRLQRLGEPLESIAGTLMPAPAAQPAGAAGAAGGETVEADAQHVASLLAATVSLFKAVVRRDWSDVNLVISHINIITMTSKSQGVVREVAQIAREIYNSLNEFSRDLSFEALSHATDDIPDAVVKLNSVIQRLEEFAHASLDKLEQLTADALDDEHMIAGALAALAACEGDLDAIAQADPNLAGELAQIKAELNAEVGGRLTALGVHRQRARDDYMTLISNMSFQDLTGQTLKKVIGFVEDLQSTLIALVTRKQGGIPRAAQPPAAVPTEGPDPGRGRAPLSQGNVDKMLADLGF